MKIKVSDALAIFGTFFSLILVIGGGIWWYMADSANREPIVAMVTGVIPLTSGIIRIYLRKDSIIIKDKERDRQIFAEANRRLPESIILSICEEVESTHRRFDNELEACEALESFFKEIGNSFSDKLLEKRKTSFLSALCELNTYTAAHFFTPISSNHNFYVLRPEIKNKARGGDVRARAEYDKCVNELRKLTMRLREEFKKYRIAVKNRLAV